MYALASAIVQLVNIYQFIVLARVLMSWIPIDRSNSTMNSIAQFLYDATEPLLAPIRNALPQMGIDISPIILFIGLNVVTNIIVGILV